MILAFSDASNRLRCLAITNPFQKWPQKNSIFKGFVHFRLKHYKTSKCYVIDAVTNHGQYTIWIDPQRGYNILKAEVQKKSMDLAWGKPLNFKPKSIPMLQSRPPVKTNFSFYLDNVLLENIKDVWVPIEAENQRSYTYEDGRVMTVKSHHKRNEINLNPNFEMQGFFVPDDVPDGTQAYFTGIGGGRFVWHNGRPVPQIDDEYVKMMDNKISQLDVESKGDSSKTMGSEVLMNDTVNGIGTQSPIYPELPKTQQLIEPESKSFLKMSTFLIGLVIIGFIILLILFCIKKKGTP